MFKSRLLKESLAYLPAQVLAPVSQLLLTISLTFLGDARTVGVVTTTFANQELMILLAAWWGHYVMRHLNERDLRPDHLWGTSRMVNGVAAVGQALLGAALCYATMAGETFALAAVQGAYFAFRSYSAFNAQVAMVGLRRVDFTVYSLSGPLVGLCLSIPALAWLGPDPVWVLAASTVGEALAAAYRLTRGRSAKAADHLRFSREQLVSALAFGLPILASGIFSWFSLNAGRYVILWWGGVEQVGLFAIGFGLGLRSAGMLSMVTTGPAWALVLKEVAEHGREAALRQHARNFTALAGLLVPAAVGLFLLRSAVVDIMVAAPFRPDAVLILPVSTLAGVMLAFQMHYANQLFLLDKRSMALLWLGVLDAAVTFTATLACVHLFGLLGGALGLLIGKSILFIGTVAWAYGRAGLIIPWAGLGAIASATLAMAGVVNALPAEPALLWLVLRTGLGAAAYFGALYLILVAGRRRAEALTA